MPRYASCLTGLFLILAAVNATAKEPAGEEDAVTAARAWLALVDEGEDARSWDEAAEYFRNAAPLDQWVQSLEAVRRPLGRAVSREVIRAERTTSLPGAPDGEYVVIRFRASFENKASAVETVTPVLGRDGTWRVTGYYIR
jgi:hypothetical protein